MQYSNIIFDLYGTLVDIRTNEDKPSLWKRLALFYGYYGAHYEPEELHQAYQTTVSRLESELSTSDCATLTSIRTTHTDGTPPQATLAGSTPSQAALTGNASSQAVHADDMHEVFSHRIVHTDDIHEAHPEIQIEHVFSALYAAKGILADDALVLHTGQFFRVLSTERLRLYPHAAELLAALRDAGAHVYLLSNAQRIFTEYEMHLLGIAEYFDDIFISSDCGTKKPDARFFHLLLDKYRIDPAQAIMIGNDGTSDIAGAKAVGLHTLYIHSAISPKEEMPDADYLLKKMDLQRVERILMNNH